MMNFFHHFYILLNFACIYNLVKAEIQQFQALLGGRAELPCNTTVPSHFDKIHLVLWYRESSRVPLYSVDARHSGTEHHPAPELAGRAVFDTPSSRTAAGSVLRLEPVEPGDAGIYRCRVDFRWGRTHTTTVELQVIVPPQEVIILSSEEKEINGGVVGPLNEGTQLIILCDAEGGQPTPSVTWWRDRTLLDDSFAPVETNGSIVRNALTLGPLSRSDLKATLTCQASNNNVTPPLTSSVTLDLNLRPLEVRISSPPSGRVVSAGLRIEAVCSTSGSRPPAHVTWWRALDGQESQLTNSTERVSANGNLTTSILSLVPTKLDHGASLVCRSENPRLSSSSHDSLPLNISYVPDVRLTASETEPEEGSNVQLTCQVVANPPELEVGWQFEGEPLFHNPALGIVIVQGRSLVLHRASRERAGAYRCFATNREGQGLSNLVRLHISYSPECAPRQERLTYGVARDEAVHVTCDVEARPSDVTFRWTFNSSLTGDEWDVATFSTSGLRSTATVIPRGPADYGTLACRASNSAGSQGLPCFFRLIQVGTPDAVSNCSTTQMDDGGLRVACQAGDSGGAEQTFHLEVFNAALDKLEANLTNSRSPEFRIESQHQDTSLFLAIYAANPKGRSPFVTLTTRLSAHSSNNDDSLISLNPILGALVGVVGCFLLIAAGVIMAIRRRAREVDKGTRDGSQTRKDPGGQVRTTINKDGEEADSINPDVIPPKYDIPADYHSEDEEWSSIKLNNASSSLLDRSPKENFSICEGGIISNIERTIKRNKSLRYSPPGTVRRATTGRAHHWGYGDRPLLDASSEKLSNFYPNVVSSNPLATTPRKLLSASNLRQFEERTLSTPV